MSRLVASRLNIKFELLGRICGSLSRNVWVDMEPELKIDDAVVKPTEAASSFYASGRRQIKFENRLTGQRSFHMQTILFKYL